MSIMLKEFCLAHRKHPDQAHVWRTVGRMNEHTPPPEADGNQEAFDSAPSFPEKPEL